jgi:hypothetical protein
MVGGTSDLQASRNSKDLTKVSVDSHTEATLTASRNYYECFKGDIQWKTVGNGISESVCLSKRLPDLFPGQSLDAYVVSSC